MEQRTRFRRHRAALAVLVAAVLARPAAAQTVFEADGTVSFGYDRRTTVLTESSSRLDVRPALALQVGTPRLVWRVGYLFAGSLTLAGEGTNSYSHDVNLSLAAQLTERTVMTLSGGMNRGVTEFRLSQRAPEAGAPELRAPGNPALLTATLGEALAWEASPQLRLGQGLGVSASAPQDDLGRRNAVVTGSLSLHRLYPRDAFGVVYTPRFADLRPLVGEEQPSVRVLTNSIQGSWNHDFDPRWNGHATAGVEQVSALDGDAPARVHPTGSVTVRYLAGDLGGALAYVHGAMAGLETGTMSLSDEIVLRGSWTLGLMRQLGASAGYLRSRPLGGAGIATGRGDALQGDVGLSWGLSDALLFTARYSVSYQFAQGAGTDPSLIHVMLVGVTAHYGTAPRAPPVPSLGGRVDGGDAERFPGEDRPEP